jgi:RNA polymerase sigma factor (TIGR02999 family)
MVNRIPNQIGSNPRLTTTGTKIGMVSRQILRRERTGHTLTPTDLVHEAYVRLVDQTRVSWRDRSHFFSIASQACRRVLVDHARRRLAQKRGAGGRLVTLNENIAAVDDRTEEILAVNRALDRLAGVDDRLRRVVEFRYFGGLSDDETAEALGISPRTVRRDWVKAKGWLLNELRSDTPVEPDTDPAQRMMPDA